MNTAVHMVGINVAVLPGTLSTHGLGVHIMQQSVQYENMITFRKLEVHNISQSLQPQTTSKKLTKPRSVVSEICNLADKTNNITVLPH